MVMGKGLSGGPKARVLTSPYLSLSLGAFLSAQIRSLYLLPSFFQPGHSTNAIQSAEHISGLIVFVYGSRKRLFQFSQSFSRLPASTELDRIQSTWRNTICVYPRLTRDTPRAMEPCANSACPHRRIKNMRPRPLGPIINGS